MATDDSPEMHAAAFEREYARWLERGLDAGQALWVVMRLLRAAAPRRQEGAETTPKWRLPPDGEEAAVEEALIQRWRTRLPTLFEAAPEWQEADVPEWALGAMCDRAAEVVGLGAGLRATTRSAVRARQLPDSEGDLIQEAWALLSSPDEVLGRDEAGRLAFGVRAIRDAMGGRVPFTSPLEPPVRPGHDGERTEAVVDVRARDPVAEAELLEAAEAALARDARKRRAVRATLAKVRDAGGSRNSKAAEAALYAHALERTREDASARFRVPVGAIRRAEKWVLPLYQREYAATA